MAGRYQKGFDMSILDSLKCWLGAHDFERVGPIVPIKEKSGRTEHYIGPYAMGKCRRCPKLEMRRSFTPGAIRIWRGFEALTFEQYIGEYEGDWSNE